MELIETIKVGAALGECPLWCERSQSLWWTDIESRTLYRYDWVERRLERFATPERLASFGFIEGRKELIAAFANGFAFFEPNSGAVTWLARIETPGIRLNDGRVDPKGRFWSGGFAEDDSYEGQAALYCFDGELRVRETGLAISNSICWSPDGAHMYFADTPRRLIWRYAFDAEEGTISKREDFVDAGACPDGSAVDAEGGLWNAQWGAGRVVRYAQDGRMDLVLEVPATQPTSVAFGGPRLNLLFVTSARQGLSPEALARDDGAGEVFVYNTQFVGLPEKRFSVGPLECKLSGEQR